MSVSSTPLSSRSLPENAPFTVEQKVALNALLPSLQAAQASWLSGFFAALGMEGASAVATQASAAVPLTILVGTESGNSEICASKAKVAAQAAGFHVTVVDMGDYNRTKLRTESNVMIICSTWGEGDPPERAQEFYKFMLSEAAPRLEHVRYSTFALGDTSYVHFCKCGRDFDERFAALGAQRLSDRVDSDVDFEEPFDAWLAVTLPRFIEASGVGKQAAAVAGSGTITLPVPAVAAKVWSKKNPFPARLTEKINLNGTGSLKETLHLELSLQESGLSYKPGDALGVIARNCPEVVNDLLQVAGLSGTEEVGANGKSSTLRELLTREYDVTGLSKNLMSKYASLAGSKKLDTLLHEDHNRELQEFIYGREVRDLLVAFPPSARLQPEQLLEVLRKLPPRLYSIASSLKAHPGEAHLTVSVVRYESHGKARKGVCSSYLGDRVAVDAEVEVYVHENRSFALPEDPNTPIIMVGPGTGIAPFRAFLEERAAIGAKGRNWLFFGDQRFQYDFLYQTEWQDYLKDGLLTRMDVAFSRDTEKKVYVQHRMHEHARDLYAWLEEGAHFYVCGDANRMAKDVHQALIDIVAQQAGVSTADAETRVLQYQKDRRYQRDVY